MHSLLQLLHHSLSLQSFNRIRVRSSRHNYKGHHCDGRVETAQLLVQQIQSIQIHIHTLIPVLIPTSSEKIQRVIQIKVQMTIKVTSDKIMNLGLVLSVKILKLMQSTTLLSDIKTVRRNTISLLLQQMLSLIRSDVGYGSKDIGTIGSSSLHTVAVVDATFASFIIDIKQVQRVVKVHTTRTQVST